MPGARVKVVGNCTETPMPRSNPGGMPLRNHTEDRKSIEQRARDAATPFVPEKKGCWPFPVEQPADADATRQRQPQRSRD